MWFVLGVVVMSATLIPSYSLQPPFSWDHVPVFYHSGNSSGPIDPDFIVSHPFAMATFEKMSCEQCAPANDDAETKIIAAARSVKEAAQKAGKKGPMTIFYLNSVMNWDMYRLSREVPSSQLVHLKSGGLARLVNQTVFDLTQAAMRRQWLSVVEGAVGSGWVDGVFADRGKFSVPSSYDVDPKAFAAGEQAMLQAAQTLVNASGVVVSNNQDYVGVGGRMWERWGYIPQDFDGNAPAQDIASMRKNAELGIVGQAHAGEPCDAANFNRSLAQFLVAVGPFQYYACTDGWTVTAGSNIWHPEFEKALGTPLGPANVSRSTQNTTTWTRMFQSGTKALFSQPQDVMHSTGCICWADGDTTGPPGCNCDGEE